MNFGFTEEQDLLRSEARKLLDGRCPMAEVRRLAATAEGYSADLWRQLAELGWLGLTVPEVHGGAGLLWIDLAVLLEETGRSLFPSPLVAHLLAASALLAEGSAEQQREYLPGLANGACIGSVAILEETDVLTPDGIRCAGERDGDNGDWVLRGDKHFVCDPEVADLFVVAFRTGRAHDALGLALVPRDAAGVETKAFPLMDQTKRLGDLRLDAVRVPKGMVLGEPGRSAPAVAALLDRGAVAVTAEMIGSAQAALDLSVQYAKDRIQFGSPIGRFQGVKHPLAEMHVQLESARSLLYYAAWTIDEEPDEVARAASRAKAYAGDAFARIGVEAIQVHGTLGYTEACDAQLYLKRSKWTRLMFGDSETHYERLLEMRGL